MACAVEPRCVRRLPCLVLCAFLLLHLPIVCDGSLEESKLLTDLTLNYNYSVRPVRNDSLPLKVYMGLSISQIIDVDERNQVMKTGLWVKQRWHDYRLQWKPANYSNVSVIHIPIMMLWSPDLLLYNNVHDGYKIDLVTKAQVYANGTVSWSPPAVFYSACAIDVHYFPFDKQDCKLKFGSWTYDESKIDLESLGSTVDRQDYWENAEWEIVDTPVVKHTIKYPCCEQTYVDITFHFKLHRKSLFYVVTFVVPCVLITMITILVFYLPSNCGERTTLCISILLAVIVFLLLIAEMIPTTSDTVPLIGCYLLFTMGIVSVSIVTTIIIINLFHRSSETHTMSPWVKTFFTETLPPFLHIQRPANYRDYICSAPPTPQPKRKVYVNSSDSPATDRSCFHNKKRSFNVGRSSSNYHLLQRAANNNAPKMMALNCSLEEEMEWRDSDEEKETNVDHNRQTEIKKEKLPARLKEGLDYLSYIVERTKDEDKAKRTRNDWEFVAMVIDRIFLWIYLLTVVIGTLVIMLSSPVLWENVNKFSQQSERDKPEIRCTYLEDLLPNSNHTTVKSQIYTC
ncbi:neuronal acetylcholine receptor subunit alpha-3-like isoform X1 [Acanthaster planci]|uniref:Neuronal acetylcholine receptor subunit alpha-3-like isoform X1 n=1 Tax=Acanthaster planci TaxID=133434 RepID=A0A8B7YU65_ACAPL|nr:neuronal acetylcholine receptor subunit alpha-3-like isoform X1 [Acanthaster planci]